jgi:hypothetical protein
MEEKRLGQCRRAGVTEEHIEKAFGLMEEGWSDRSEYGKDV